MSSRVLCQYRHVFRTLIQLEDEQNCLFSTISWAPEQYGSFTGCRGAAIPATCQWRKRLAKGGELNCPNPKANTCYNPEWYDAGSKEGAYTLYLLFESSFCPWNRIQNSVKRQNFGLVVLRRVVVLRPWGGACSKRGPGELFKSRSLTSSQAPRIRISEHGTWWGVYFE